MTLLRFLGLLVRVILGCAITAVLLAAAIFVNFLVGLLFNEVAYGGVFSDIVGVWRWVWTGRVFGIDHGYGHTDLWM